MREVTSDFYYKAFTGPAMPAPTSREEVRKVLTKAGFKRGKYNPSTYYHEKEGIKAIVHGDDFISLGSRRVLRWFTKVFGEQVRDQHGSSRRRLRRSSGDK